MKNLTRVLTLSFLLLLASCARAPIKSPDEAMRPASWPSVANDDMNFKDLAEAILKSVAQLETLPEGDLKFGARSISRRVYIGAMKDLAESLKKDASGALFSEQLHKNFEIHEVYGEKEWGDALISSYYEPMLKGSLKKTEKFSEPIYSTPKDLVSIRLREFSSRYGAYSTNSDTYSDAKWPETTLRARLNLDNQTVEPYLSRAEIQLNGLSKKISTPLAWVDPIDAFFLHTQGSGAIELESHTQIHVGYASQNGYPYVNIGKMLFDKIPKETMSRQKIEAYLRSLKPEDSMAFMNQNPSFIFFQKLKGAPITFSGCEVTAGRTIATDARYFPKGTLAFLEYQKPDFKDDATTEPIGFHKSQRFVVDQDTGGAIRGPGRVDLFAGSGADADRFSGVMRHRGRLYYLVPKR